MADSYADELRKLAETLDEAKRELNLAREQSTKPKHLYIRARRAAVQAARAVAAAVDLGFSEIWPQGWWVLSALRNPDDPDRPPATIQVGEWKAEMRSMKLGSGCNSDGTLRDDTAFAVWIQQICPVMRSRQTTGKADAGAFDIPKVKTDDQGRILGRDGKPLQLVEKTDPETGEPAGSYLQGTEARVTDDYDEADALEHLRCQAADWVDACDVAADLIRKESTIAKWRPKFEGAAQGLMEAEARLVNESDVNAIIEAVNPAQGDDEAEANGTVNVGPIPVARTASESVLLFDRHGRPVVNGTEKPTLTNAQYDVVLALLQTGDKGLTKDELDRESRRGDARKILKRLSDADSDWQSVISFPGTTGKGYRII